jgi:hypothetical protein
MTCPGGSGEHLTVGPLAVFLRAADRPVSNREVQMLFVGDDWAEDHHDVEVVDEDGRRLAWARLPEGIAGLPRLYELIAEHLTDEDVGPGTGFVVLAASRGEPVASITARGPSVD